MFDWCSQFLHILALDKYTSGICNKMCILRRYTEDDTRYSILVGRFKSKEAKYVEPNGQRQNIMHRT